MKCDICDSKEERINELKEEQEYEKQDTTKK